jgi:hypothetical protein
VTQRVRRLAVTSAWALGVIWLLWLFTLGAPSFVGLLLVLGWIGMPAVLWLSLTRPRLRLALIVPAAFVTVAVAVVASGPLADDVARAGWIALLAGLALGAVQGAWLWFGWLPVPAALRDPLARPRLALITTHVALVLSGMVAVTAAALS